jgi:hypothetical protein
MYLLFGLGIFFIAGCCKAGGPKGCFDCWSECCECFSGMLHDMCCKKEDKTKKTSGSNAYHPPQPESPSPYIAMQDAPVGNSVQRDDFCISCRAPNPESKPFCANCGSRTS